MNVEFPQTIDSMGCSAPFFNHDGNSEVSVGLMEEEEAFLASEIKNLSFQERNKALEDVHCVGEGEKENPEMIKQALIEFQGEVESQADPIYMRAYSRNRGYVEDPAFRLMFLRCKLYDAKQAARQMISFLRNQDAYFGSHTLGRDIAFTDLEEEDKQILKSGIFHIQAERDKAGRVVVILFNDMFLRNYKIESMIRAGYFMIFNCVRSRPDVQLQGVTTIFYDVVRADGQQKNQSWDAVLTLMNRALILPMRHSSMHYCMKTNGTSFSLNKVFLKVMLNGFPKYTIVRSRFHYGHSDVELQSKIRGYGVPLNTFPVDKLGNIREDLIDVWYNENCCCRANSNPSGTIVFTSSINSNDAIMATHNTEKMTIRPELTESCTLSSETLVPKTNDVLLGRGKRIQKHPGNISFRDWMYEHRSEYDGAYKFKRRQVAMELKNRYAENGVRFLKQTSDFKWSLANEEETEEKVKQLFRSFRRGGTGY
ncbi:unnamed protein product [Cylindrotheca closterium]|uniref:DUF6824 domain-containing protein n=1 Tax=Cylindrotheca closterium TaxID=2856 RepID=A0AAD2CKZ1_9STRA|nr:unnamed protein product [Cylindrotheca closterium]